MKILVFTMLLFVPLFASAAEFESRGLTLLQPESVVEERQPDPKAMVQYIRSVQDALRESVRGVESKPASGFVAIAVRSGGKTNAWLDLSPAVPEQVGRKMLEAVRAVPGFAITKGTLVFAIKVSLGGAALPEGNMPRPKEWTSAMAGAAAAMEIEALVNKIWP